MKIAIAVSVLSLSFAFQPESVFANKVPTPERLQINNLPHFPVAVRYGYDLSPVVEFG